MNPRVLLKWDRSNSVPVAGVGKGKTFNLNDGIQGYKLIWSHGFIINRDELIKRHRLSQSLSDKDLIVRLYNQFGGGTAPMIHGPFTWVLWDNAQYTLVLVRDRIGIYGIYYAVTNCSVTIADNVESLLDSNVCAGSFNTKSVIGHINGIAPLADETYYRGISCVEPGTQIEISPYKLRKKRYWNFKTQPALKLKTNAEYTNAYRHLLFDVVDDYLPNSPVAVTLSGGLDSTSIAAAARAGHPDRLLTAYSWISPGIPEDDESQAIAMICEKLRLDCVRMDVGDMLAVKGNDWISTKRASPLSNIFTKLWTDLLTTIRGHDIAVVLSGISGDHLFSCGISSYPDLLLTGHWIELVRQLRAHRSGTKFSLTQLVRNKLAVPLIRAYLPNWRYPHQPPVPWLAETHHRAYKQCCPPPQRPMAILPGRRHRLELLKDPMLTTGCEIQTRHAAEHSIDLRHPLLDHRLFEFAASLPSSQAYYAGQNKIIMRNAMRGYLPDYVVNFKDKVYPETISKRMLLNHTSEVCSLTQNMRTADLGLIDPVPLRKAVKSALAGNTVDWSFYNTLTLEDWLRRYF